MKRGRQGSARKIIFTGGPWDGQEFLTRTNHVQSIRFSLRGFIGCYDLWSGNWME